mgnify:CR=1 FL=1
MAGRERGGRGAWGGTMAAPFILRGVLALPPSPSPSPSASGIRLAPLGGATVRTSVGRLPGRMIRNASASTSGTQCKNAGVGLSGQYWSSNRFFADAVPLHSTTAPYPCAASAAS